VDGQSVRPAIRPIPPVRWAIVGSWVIVHAPSIGRAVLGQVREVDGNAFAVQTDVGLLRVRRRDCQAITTTGNNQAHRHHDAD
jgi:hypothetical protein